MLAFLALGAGIGFVLGVSPGPVLTLVVTETLKGGWLRGAAVAARSPAPANSDPVAASSRFEKIQRENTELRRARRELAEHLELAIANIQRLTLDNHHLRQQLHAATKITHINAPSRG